MYTTIMITAEELVTFLRTFPPTRHINFAVGPVDSNRRYGIDSGGVATSQDELVRIVSDILLNSDNASLLEVMATKPTVYVTVTHTTPRNGSIQFSWEAGDTQLPNG